LWARCASGFEFVPKLQSVSNRGAATQKAKALVMAASRGSANRPPRDSQELVADALRWHVEIVGGVTGVFQSLKGFGCLLQTFERFWVAGSRCRATRP